jgi:hypothetical protein
MRGRMPVPPLLAASALAAAVLAWAVPAAPATRQSTAAAFRDSVGVNTAPTYYDTPYGRWDQVVARVRALGVRHIRAGFFWSSNAGWNTREADALRSAFAEGIRFNLVVNRTCSHDGTLAPCLAAIRTRLPVGSVASVEWPNEHDLFGGPTWRADLADWGRRLHAGVKADPALRSIRVLGPSLVHKDAPLVLGDQTAFLDAGNLHPYTGAKSPGPEHIAQERARMRPVSGNAPLVATEAGFHTSPAAVNQDQPAADEPTAAVYTLRTVLEHFASGIERTYVYELLDQRDDPLHSKANFGLLRTDFSPKPAFTALQRLLGMIGTGAPVQRAPLAFRLSGAPGDLRSLVLQQDARRHALVIWRTASVWDRDAKRPLTVAPRRVGVALPGATGVAVGSPLRGASPLPVALAGGAIALDVGADPLVVLVTRAEEAPAAAAGALPASGPPAAARDRTPPRIAGLRIRRVGRRHVAVFRLSERARVAGLVRRGTRSARFRTVRRTRARTLGPGRRRLAVGRLRRGRYRLRLGVRDAAGNGGRRTLTFRVRRRPR